jgi:hypothetical protein
MVWTSWFKGPENEVQNFLKKIPTGGIMNDKELRKYIAFIFGDSVAYKYNHMLTKGYRRGQAFMNSIPSVYYNQLIGSIADPFNYDLNLKIIEAIEYLTNPLNGDQERVNA